MKIAAPKGESSQLDTETSVFSVPSGDACSAWMTMEVTGEDDDDSGCRPRQVCATSMKAKPCEPDIVQHAF